MAQSAVAVAVDAVTQQLLSWPLPFLTISPSGIPWHSAHILRF
jgi:hypothetical protein